MTHQFFAKSLRQRLTIPNKIVVQSRSDDDPQYSGYAQDAESYALMPKVEYFETYLTSNDQATAIAEAKLAMAQLWCTAGSISVPLNLAQEPFDYVRVVDSREGDERVGNIGRLTRHYSVSPSGRQSSRWEMVATFGDWQTVRKALANLNITSDELQNYFSRLSVGDLYVEHILADNVDFVWIDPDNTIDLSKIGDNLDNLPDGEVYARVKSLHLDAGQIKLDENVWYKVGYDPSTKWTGSDLDDLPDGTVYHRVKSASLTAEGLILLDQVTVGTYGLVLAADISAGHILLSSVVQSSSYRTASDTEKATWNGKPDNMDEIPNGSTYEKVLATDISAGHILLSSCSGDLGDIDGNLDDIANGATYAKVRATEISGGYIQLTSSTVKSGEWYDESGVEIDAANGINIYGKNNALTTRATKTGTIQCYVGSDGKIYAGAGSVFLDSSGITIIGKVLTLKYGSSVRGYVYGTSTALYIEGTPKITIETPGAIELVASTAVKMNLAGYLDLPQRSSAPSTYQAGTIFFNTATHHLQYWTGSKWVIAQETDV